jgi:phosphoglycolate phosphatase-like HAD superfamily hydrolase
MPIEIIHPDIERGRIRSALFDFDGTLSLIREGWQQVMIPMMVQVLAETPGAEDEGALHATVKEYVEELTGKQTIYQMLRLREEVIKRGGQPRDPLDYKRAYLERLRTRIAYRLAALEEGAAHPDGYLVPGARAMLESLRSRGVVLYLASGTDHADVLREARLLDLVGYFGDNIYGALDRYWEFSKARLIAQIIDEHALSGPEFLGVGDGFVEIENTKQVGGIAVGVASDEVRRQGVNEWKRQRLIRAGADLIVPDFREHARLTAYLFGEVDQP